LQRRLRDRFGDKWTAGSVYIYCILHFSYDINTER